MPRSFCLALSFFACFLLGCSGEAARKKITLATTTSTQDSGLLDVLLPAFEHESGIKVTVVAVGSGQALELGRRGDVDVVLTHSPDAEKKFMDQGWGEKRLRVMHNDFVIVGPAEDQAGIKEAQNAANAFKMIASARASFISRGDDSGTHQKEQSIWKEGGVDPKGTWYVQAGTGMAQALRMAHEKKSYVLSDRATYLALTKEVELIVLLEGDEQLFNRYTVITVSPDKHQHVHRDEALRFVDFLVSPEGQSIIGAFGIERYGQRLFVPNAENGVQPRS